VLQRCQLQDGAARALLQRCKQMGPVAMAVNMLLGAIDTAAAHLLQQNLGSSNCKRHC
jgi:hypothetical protein